MCHNLRGSGQRRESDLIANVEIAISLTTTLTSVTRALTPFTASVTTTPTSVGALEAGVDLQVDLLFFLRAGLGSVLGLVLMSKCEQHSAFDTNLSDKVDVFFSSFY